MAIDLFEQLASQEVPPPPENLTGRVHERLNRTLVVVHVVELLFGVLPWAATLLARGVWGWLHLTLTGSYADRRTPRRPGDDRSK